MCFPGLRSETWGTRLPVLFAASAFVLVHLWSKGLRARILLSGLIALCCAVSLLAVFVNYTAAVRLDAQVNDSKATRPRQILDTVEALRNAFTGGHATGSSHRAETVPPVFPDLVATQIAASLKRKSTALAAGFVLLYLAGLGYFFWNLWSPSARRTVWRGGEKATSSY
jgi:hypothetical protein